MKTYRLLILALASLAAAPAFANPELAKAKNCMACHAIDKKVVGPAFKEIAAKYSGQKGIEAKLATKIVQGGGGAWGPMPMPPNALSAQEAATLAKWILAQK
ncbi:MAG TPA: c-type cytochrome [Telluria sp.]|nr:c-type cytochrome [Telluria sp.]